MTLPLEVVVSACLMSALAGALVVALPLAWVAMRVLQSPVRDSSHSPGAESAYDRVGAERGDSAPPLERERRLLLAQLCDVDLVLRRLGRPRWGGRGALQ